MGRQNKTRSLSRWRKVNDSFASVKGYGDGLVSGNPWSVLSGDVTEKISDNDRMLRLNRYVGHLVRSKKRRW